MRDIEPNYGVHLQVATHIKAKKANTPREAAVAVARLTNHRNPHVAILALASSTPLLPSAATPSISRSPPKSSSMSSSDASQNALPPSPAL
ncbi:hypothetical protein C0993_004692, partial [Termitomyces sp. T159_Od127]